jgi:hypothetical protein
MSDNEITAGIAGACARGGSFKDGLEAEGLRVKAVCDINEDQLPAAADEIILK